MLQEMNTRPSRDAHGMHEPLYDTDPVTGAKIEVFFADLPLAKSFGARGPGWFWWSCFRAGLLPEPPIGPFIDRDAAHRDAVSEDSCRTRQSNDC